MSVRPKVLVIDADRAHRQHVIDLLVGAGWNAEGAEPGKEAVEALQREDLALLIVACDTSGEAMVRDVRGGTGPGSGIPIVGMSTARHDKGLTQVRRAGMDGHVVKPIVPEELLAAVEPWRPSDGPHPATALVATFGEAAIAGLLAGLRTQLADAIEADEDAAHRRARAHRIAGLSGTLGFAAVSRAWLDVSEGNDVAWDAARVTARQAIHLIDRSAPLGRG